MSDEKEMRCDQHCGVVLGLNIGRLYPTVDTKASLR